MLSCDIFASDQASRNLGFPHVVLVWGVQHKVLFHFSLAFGGWKFGFQKSCSFLCHGVVGYQDCWLPSKHTFSGKRCSSHRGSVAGCDVRYMCIQAFLCTHVLLHVNGVSRAAMSSSHIFIHVSLCELELQANDKWCSYTKIHGNRSMILKWHFGQLNKLQHQ